MVAYGEEAVVLSHLIHLLHCFGVLFFQLDIEKHQMTNLERETEEQTFSHFKHVQTLPVPKFQPVLHPHNEILNTRIRKAPGDFQPLQKTRKGGYTRQK